MLHMTDQPASTRCKVMVYMYVLSVPDQLARKLKNS